MRGWQSFLLDMVRTFSIELQTPQICKKRTYQTLYVPRNNTEYVSSQRKERPSTARDTPQERAKAQTNAQHKQMHPASSQPREHPYLLLKSLLTCLPQLSHETRFSDMSPNPMSHPRQMAKPTLLRLQLPISCLFIHFVLQIRLIVQKQAEA